ncbi:MAG: hypothetical protein FWF29_08705 [Treponema sp.]|nr:hypothetical protein [Treponema sp.]
MAGISMSDNILNILKIVYRDGVQSLLFRNSPVLREIVKSRTEGKELRYAAMYGRGGACGGDYGIVKAQAAETARNEEWKTVPGQIFSALTINQKEILASKSRKGAYMTVLGNKVFAALEAERKQLAKALYGTGYGEFGVAKAAGTLAAGSNTITLQEEEVIGIDVGTQFRFIKPDTNGTLGASATVSDLCSVTQIDGTIVTFSTAAAGSYAIGDVLCFEGSRTPNGEPWLPVGLGAWLPTVGNRTGTSWTNYINVPLYGVNRSKATDRLAGQFVLSGNAGTYKIADVISDLFRKCRRAGAEVDLIVMNDRKYAELIAELNANTTYWQSINDSSKASKTGATKGFNEIAFAFSTSWLNKVVDDPYCPYNKVFILEKKNLELVTYSNAEKVINDGVSSNEPGKADPEMEDGASFDQNGCRINIDDLVTIEPGTATAEGPAHCVSFNIYGTFVLFNTANSGVAVLQ